MSFQPPPPMGQMPPPAPYMPPTPYSPPPVQVAPQPASTPRGGRVLRWCGVISLVIGVVLGGVLVALSASAVDDTVGRFARAPQGCTTTLDIDRADTYTLFVETRGVIETEGGDCAANNSSYDSSGSTPTVELTLVDAEGREVDLRSADGVAYSTDRFEGSTIATVRIEDPGSYELTVSSEVAAVAVAVGHDPYETRNLLVGSGVVVFVVGVVVGLVLLLSSRARRRRTPPPPLWPSIPTGPASPANWAPPQL